MDDFSNGWGGSKTTTLAVIAGDGDPRDPGPMPAALRIIPDNIPRELRGRRQWVLWRWELRADKKGKKSWTKPPYQFTGHKAKSNDPSTWNSFEAVLLALRTGQFSGIGYCLTANDPYTILDGDSCRNVETGEVADWALDLLGDWPSYAEVSPSGRGIRAIGIGHKPGDQCGPKKYEGGKVEMYDHSTDKYLTFTGHRLPQFGDSIEDAAEYITRIYGTVFGEDKSVGPKPSTNGKSDPFYAKLTDDDLLAAARKAKNGDKFTALYDRGDLSYHDDDESKADAGLCAMLAFYCHSDRDRMDRLFRGSALFRDKWDERRGRTTYGGRTLDYAIRHCTEHYSPPGPTPTIGGTKEREGYTIILDHFRHVYRPAFRRGTSLYSSALGREVKVGEATVGAPKKLLDELAAATNAPRTKDGSISYNHLPQFFNSWCRSAWVDVLNSLPDEEGAADPDQTAAEEFRRLVRHALLSQITFSIPVKDLAGNVMDHRPERRALIDWCEAWADPEKKDWQPVRSYRCYFRWDGKGEGEGALRVAIRHELFGQLAGTDRRLVEMSAAAFAKKARLYGVGSAGDDERPQGRRAVVLDPAFVESLTAAVEAEEQKER